MQKRTKPRDARSLDHKTLEELRRLAVTRVLAGETHRAVAASLQVHRMTVAKWMAWYRAEGEAGLASTVGTGRPRTLTPQQEARLKRLIIGKDPRQLNFGPALWTLRLVGELVTRRFGVVLHIATIARLLDRLGITPQKPTRQAFQRDPVEGERWMTEEFPRIVREARRRQAVLVFLDETGVREDQPVGRTWGERGQRPVVRVKGTRRRTNCISAITPRGQLWFRCFPDNLTAATYIDFLKALCRTIRKPIILIHDRHPAHVAAATCRFIQAQGRRLTVYHFPGYAPDLNPDEHVGTHLKQIFRQDPLALDERIEARVESTMTKLQRDRAAVRKFFQHPAVEYIRKALHWK
jgi:transposase